MKRLFLVMVATIGMVILGLGALGSTATATNTPTGNNGTVKVHEQGTPDGTESNDPKVCVFNLEGFGFDANQEFTVVFTVQGGDGPTGTDAGPFGPYTADANGLFATNYYTLEPGHYKATLYGKDTAGGYTQDLKAKSKVFKVTCEETPPTTTTTVPTTTTPSTTEPTTTTPTTTEPTTTEPSTTEPTTTTTQPTETTGTTEPTETTDTTTEPTETTQTTATTTVPPVTTSTTVTETGPVVTTTAPPATNTVTETTSPDNGETLIPPTSSERPRGSGNVNRLGNANGPAADSGNANGPAAPVAPTALAPAAPVPTAIDAGLSGNEQMVSSTTGPNLGLMGIGLGLMLASAGIWLLIRRA